MPTFEYSAIVPCAPLAAWAAATDFPSRPAHSQRYRRADLPDGVVLEPGNRINLQIGRDRFTSVVMQAEPPAILSHRTTGPGFWCEYSYNLRECNDGDPGYTSDDPGNAFLTVTVEYGGWLGRLVAKFRPGACRRYVADEVNAIVSAAESVMAEPV